MSPATSTAFGGTVGQPVSEPPAVIVRDQFGDPMFGIAVTFAVTGGGGSVTEASAFSDAQGVARVGSWTLGTTAGPQTLTASAGPLTPVTFTATAQAGAAASITKTAGDNQTAPVASAVPIAPAVTIRDQFNNVVSGVAVVFAASAGGSVTGGSVLTNNAGVAAVGSWTLGNVSGANTLTATAGALTTTFAATATAGAATTLTRQAGDNQTATVATAVAVAPSVLVTDALGNPVPGATVTFAVGTGGGSVTGGTQVTNASGVATVGSWTLGTAVGAKTLTASVGAVSVTFTATAIAGPAAVMTANAGDGQSAIVGTAVTVAPAVRITDVHGNPIAGASVTFAVASGAGSVTGAVATTDADGVASVGSWTLGMTAGANTLTATSGALSVTFTATGTPAPPANITKQAGDAQTATVATAVAVQPSVRITDLSGNPVSGVTVTFAVTAGAGSLTGATPLTDANGVATLGSWTLGTIAGANALSATVGSLSVTFTATGVAGAPANIAKQAGDNQTATVGTAVPIAPTVLITDIHGNPVQGVSVQFAAATGGGGVTGGSPTTNASGLASVGSWTLGNTAGANTLTATAGALQATFTATGTAGAPANITIVQGDGQTATVGSAVPVAPAVHVTDAFGNDVSGATVTFAVTDGGGSLTGGSQVTNGSGVATVGSWTLGTTAGANELTASVGALSVVFSATGTPGPAAIIEKTAGDSQTATVDTEVATDPQVRVTDAFGNPLAGVAVTFAVLTGGGSVTGGNQMTDASGLASVGSWKLGTTAGANTLQASAGSLTATFTATGTAGAPANMVKEAGDPQTATVNTAVAVDPAVRITDAFGNPVAGVSVTFAVASGGGIATGLVQATDANGIATVTSWTLGTTAGANTLTATAGLLSVTFTATGTAGPVAGILKVAGDAQSAPAGTDVPIAPAVRLFDAFGNNVEGVTVTFTVIAGDGSVTGAVQVTGANGVATVGSWTLGPTPGPNTLRATGGGVSADFSATGS